jgi:hypothetical protein
MHGVLGEAGMAGWAKEGEVKKSCPLLHPCRCCLGFSGPWMVYLVQIGAWIVKAAGVDHSVQGWRIQLTEPLSSYLLRLICIGAC